MRYYTANIEGDDPFPLIVFILGMVALILMIK